MDMKKISKTEAEEKIKKFFENIENKSPRDIKKMKKLAMSHNLQLKGLRKKFCKKCFSPDLKIRGIKKKIKTVECKSCGNLMRWGI